MTTTHTFHPVPDKLLLTYVADKLEASDRRPGNVVVVLCELGGVGPLVNVIEDAPVRPSPTQCSMLLRPFVEAAATTDRGQGAIAVGLIIHRRGAATETPLDRAWLAALEASACANGVDILGMATRTGSGALIFPRAA